MNPVVGDSRTINAYAYAANNPMTYTDPTGMCVPGVNCPWGVEKRIMESEGHKFILVPLFSESPGGGLSPEERMMWAAGTTCGVAARADGGSLYLDSTCGVAGAALLAGVYGCVRACGPAIEGLSDAADFIGNTLFSDGDLSDGADDTIPGKPFVGDNAEERAFEHLEKYHGLDPVDASERLHKIKQAAGLVAADNAIFGRTGDVYDPRNGELIGNLLTER